MWNSAEPLSPSSWRSAHVPMSRSVVADVDRHRERVGAERPGCEEPLDLVGPHRAVLVARQAGDLGVGVPALEGARGWPGTCRRRTTASPVSDLGKPAPAAPSAGTVYHRPPCVAGARSPSASPPRRGPPRRPPSSPTTSRASTAAELPIAAVFLTGRPFAEADQRADGPRLVGDRDDRDRPRRRPAERPRRGLRPIVRPGPGGRRRPRPARATHPDPARQPDPARGRRRVRRDRAGVRAGREERASSASSSPGPTR